MAKSREYPLVWVAAAPLDDPALAGKQHIRCPWDKERVITATPVQLATTPQVVRMLAMGHIVEVPAPASNGQE